MVGAAALPSLILDKPRCDRSGHIESRNAANLRRQHCDIDCASAHSAPSELLQGLGLQRTLARLAKQRCYRMSWTITGGLQLLQSRAVSTTIQWHRCIAPT